MSRAEEFKAARADKKPKGHSRKLRAARTECRYCWCTGFHDPLCRKVAQAAAMRAAKVQP